ncbi:MAG: SRPBCC family protein [Myxococcales bacterium]|nr:SRPBCC family protein [Myxococcales bacterium]
MTLSSSSFLSLDRSLWVPRPLSSVFPFFADAKNLEQLTPDWLRFQILSPLLIEMRVGALIDYRIRLYKIPMRWRTLISAWEPPYRFVDEQIRGPYSLWWHEHTFVEQDGGTLLEDHVRYRAPLGFIAHPLMVNRQLQRIFDYRTEVIRRLFGS